MNAIKPYSDEYDKAVIELENANQALTKLRSAGKSQVHSSISVNGISLDITRMDGRDYMEKLIRGREMIYLGAIKALDEIVDTAKLKVAEKKRDLIKATEELLKAREE